MDSIINNLDDLDDLIDALYDISYMIVSILYELMKAHY